MIPASDDYMFTLNICSPLIALGVFKLRNSKEAIPHSQRNLVLREVKLVDLGKNSSATRFDWTPF